MLDRACISINNRCNLNCTYCHFHTSEKEKYLSEHSMDVYVILNNIKHHIDKYSIPKFKLGFVGNGEPLLDYDVLSKYIEYIDDYLSDGRIAAYTITNGTLITEEMLRFFKAYNFNVGFSIDGIPEIHNKWRCNTHKEVMEAINQYRAVNKCYPSMNCTVGKDTLAKTEETIAFFEQFDNRVTFSRMIGTNGISLIDFHGFLDRAMKTLNVRTGGYDCTMYGGKCGAGINNIFYANGNVYICGNCVDLPPIARSQDPIDTIKPDIPMFDRNTCFKETQCI